MEGRAGVDRGQRQQQRRRCSRRDEDDADGGAAPTPWRQNGNQRDGHADARQNVFADPGTGQAVGQSVEYRVVDAVAGKVVAGVEGDIQHHEQA